MPQDVDAVGISGVAQRTAWLAKTLPPVEQLAPDLWSIPVTIPDSPLRYTSVYVLASGSRLTLIDTGTDSDEGWAQLSEGLSGIGASASDVTGCLVTHFHFDHLGLAARLQAEVGAWVGIHPADAEVITRQEYTDVALQIVRQGEWLTRLGAPAEEVARVLEQRGASDPHGGIARPDRLIEDGDRIAMSGWNLRAVHTPGHTPGHLCFYDESRRLLFGGDHVLPRISPNIPTAHADTDPLGDFLASLARIREVDADEVLPAHEWRYRDLKVRVAQLEEHHERRLAELLAIVREHPGAVPWDLAGLLTWSRPWSSYDGFMRISAVGETTAHLAQLVTRGEVVASDEPVPRYLAKRTALAADSMHS